jgi:N-acetyltransferase 10
MRKQLDPRIPILINNNVKRNHRSFIVFVGDKGRDQACSIALFFTLVLTTRCPRSLTFTSSCLRREFLPALLCCGVTKKSLVLQGRSRFEPDCLPFLAYRVSHRKKREQKIKRDVKRGVREPNEQNPFEVFVTVTDIRYTYVPLPRLHFSSNHRISYYKESHKILGNTYGMCVLQDFEAITPNLLARTIETVEGGGLVVLLLKTMTSLKQLYTMTMVCSLLASFPSHSNTSKRMFTLGIEPLRMTLSLLALMSDSFSPLGLALIALSSTMN